LNIILLKSKAGLNGYIQRSVEGTISPIILKVGSGCIDHIHVKQVR